MLQETVSNGAEWLPKIIIINGHAGTLPVAVFRADAARFAKEYVVYVVSGLVPGEIPTAARPSKPGVDVTPGR